MGIGIASGIVIHIAIDIAADIAIESGVLLISVAQPARVVFAINPLAINPLVNMTVVIMILVVVRVPTSIPLRTFVPTGIVSITVVMIRFRLRDRTASRARQQATDQTPRRAIAGIEQHFQWRRLGTDRETRANAMREFEARAVGVAFKMASTVAFKVAFKVASNMTPRTARRFPCRDMRTHRAAERFGIRERHARVTESNRLAHEFFGMTRAFEKSVIASDFDFAPTSFFVARGWHCGVMRGRRRGRSRVSAFIGGGVCRIVWRVVCCVVHRVTQRLAGCVVCRSPRRVTRGERNMRRCAWMRAVFRNRVFRHRLPPHSEDFEMDTRLDYRCAS